MADRAAHAAELEQHRPALLGHCYRMLGSGGSPAFGQYRASPAGGHTAWALSVLELDGDRVRTTTAFLDVGALFPRFDLPLTLPA